MLRKYLSSWEFAIHKQAIPTTPDKLIAICQEICTTHQAIKIESPDPKYLEKVHREICSSFFEKNEPTNIPATYLEVAPWIFYWPSSVLADSETFLSFYFEWLEKQSVSKQGHVCSAFWCELLQKYPYESATFQYICPSVLRLLSLNPKNRLKELYQCCEKYSLLSPEGAEVFCNQAEKEGIEPALLCRKIPPELWTGKFAQQGCKLYLKKISSMLGQSGKVDYLQKFIKNYQQHIDLFNIHGKEQVIDSLLLPFSETQTHEMEYKDDILHFLLENFNDPRINNMHWLGVSAKAMAVIERWFVASQLEAFFAILKQTAPEQWQDRQEFWSKYLAKQVISKAWVALGRDARKAVLFTSLPNDSFADLTHAQSEQSVLIMQINDLLVIEWTHSGSCRFCMANDQNAPSFYKTTYSGDELRLPRDRIPHVGRWQYKIADKIEEETGIKASEIVTPRKRFWNW